MAKQSSPGEKVPATPRASDGLGGWHLGETEQEARLASLEFALIGAHAAFERYVTQIARLCGEPVLNYPETLLLHIIRMHERPKDATTIARMLNRDDLANVQYTLRKLGTLGLVKKVRAGVSAQYSCTAKGIEITERFSRLRKQLLVSLMSPAPVTDDRVDEVVGRLTMLTGLYDSTARAATLVSAHDLELPPED